MIIDKYKNLKTPDFILNQIDEYINYVPKENNDPFAFLNVSSNDSESFLYDSFRFKTKKGKPFNTIPFNMEQPTFSSLNSTQKNFYFYWRSQCLEGNYIDTELSYIFLFSYELINYSFSSSAAFNVSMLVHLFDHYSFRFPKLNTYLPLWISDMLFELGEIDLANEYKDEESLLNEDYFAMKSQSSIKNITMNNWWRFLTYEDKSPFFSRNTTKIYTIFKDLLEFLDHHFQSIDKNNGIFEHLFPLVEVSEERALFNDSVLKRETVHKMSSVTKRELSLEFAAFLSEVMKVSENYLRALKKYDLLDINLLIIDLELVEAMLASLTRFDPVKRKIKSKQVVSIEEEKIVKVEFDDKNIETLSADSMELQEIFEEKYQDQEEEVEQSKANVSNVSNDKTNMSSIFNVFTKIQDSFDYEELEELSDLEKEFILLFEEDVKEIDFYSQFLRSRGIILGSFVLTINEKFEEAFDDVLFELEDNEIEFNNLFDTIFSYLKGV